ncbi:MAG: hypothetical protein K0R28_3062 [Paenibacillus sp.]|jgi:hypothetical protein|nr:hypothetical protein [Paenibacillus sp.]
MRRTKRKDALQREGIFINVLEIKHGSRFFLKKN